MKRFAIGAAFGFAVLACAAILLGGLNQDEGWYLYAANCVAQGYRPYADFAYTQGPILPYVYSAFTWVWNAWGLLGARVFTLLIGALGIVYFSLVARRIVRPQVRNAAFLVTTFLLGCNLYHLYFLAIPKTYALASFFVGLGLWLLTSPLGEKRVALVLTDVFAGAALALSAGARISLCATIAVVGLVLLLAFRSCRWRFLWFALGAGFMLALEYGMIMLQGDMREGLLYAQRYHAARGGFDPVFAVGSLSRLVRWYLPLFIVLGLGLAAGWRRVFTSNVLKIAFFSFLFVLAVQMCAPFPYEDYQVPIMGLLAVLAAVLYVDSAELGGLSMRVLLVLGLAYAASFGSPLLEKWMTNGQDRFWSIKKSKPELFQLQDVGRRIQALDPGGKELLTQDTYLAIETGRTVPKGLEMGPFSVMSESEWTNLLATASCPVAALSGYSFAIEPPKCNPRDFEQQMKFWGILKERYELVDREESFGQNATTLLILKRK